MVSSTIRAIVSAGIDGLRPRPAATLPQFARPCSSNARRHARTDTGVTPCRAAIVVFATPSAASSSTRARSTSRCAAVCDRATFSKASRWPTDITSGAAAALTHQEYRETDYLIARHTTSLVEVTGSEGRGDLLVHGEEGPRFAGLAAWVRGHRRGMVGLGLLVIAGAALAAVWYVRSGPTLPALVAASQPRDPATNLAVGPWTAGADGRPTGPPQVTMDAQLTFRQVPAAGVEVLGMDGPGLRPPTSPIRRVLPAQPTATLQLRAVVDCAAVPLPVPPGSYRLRLRVVEGSRTAEGTVPADQLSQDWGRAVDVACGSWLARSALTVTAVSGAADPLLPQAAVTLTLANRADAPATVVEQEPYSGSVRSSSVPAGPLRLPPRGTSQVHVKVDLTRCDAVPTPADASPAGTAPLDTGVLGLAATLGAVPAAAPAQTWFDGLGPTGVLFTAAAGGDLLGLLQQACGDVTAVVPLIAPGGVRLDASTRVVTIRLLLDMAPGKVTDLHLESDPYTPDPAVFTPLWTRTASLVPDYSGQATVTLAYRAPAGSCGPTSGAWLPAVTAVAHVPGPAGMRTLKYSLAVDLWQNPQAIALLCPDQTP